jgi:hypothetical protein
MIGPMRTETSPPTAHIVAAALMALKALLGFWAAMVALTASSRRTRRFLGQAVTHRAAGVGLILLIFVAATIAVAVGLILSKSWAPIATYVLEGLAVLLALIKIANRPRAAVLAIILSAVIVTLVWLGSSRARTATTPA